MKYLVFIGLFVAGGLVGYLVGSGQSNEGDRVEDNDLPEPITEFIYDTIVKTERVEVPVVEEEPDSSFMLRDSLEEMNMLDTLIEEILPRDTTKKDEDINIRKDELIASRTVPIIYLNDPVKSDTIVKELLGIKGNLPEEMKIQFWNSPLNYKGYKLSRNTLVVYGLSEQLAYEVYYKDGKHYLSNEGEFYRLNETTAFRSFDRANREDILND